MAPPERSPRAPRPSDRRSSAPRRGSAPSGGGGRPFPRRTDDDPRGSSSRGTGGERKPYARRDEGDARGSYQPRGDGDRKPYARRGEGQPRSPSQRRGEGGGAPYRRRDEGDARKPYQRRGEDDRKPYARRDGGDARGSYQRRGEDERKPYARRDGGDARGSYQRRGEGDRKPYARRDEGQQRPAYQRRGEAGGAPYRRRDDDRGPRKPYQGRGDAPRAPYRRGDDDARPSRRGDFVPAEEKPTPKWGGVTRRGARQVTNPTPASDEAKAYERRESSRGPRPTVDRWEREPTPVPMPRPKKSGGAARPIRAKALPADVVAEVASASGSSRRAPMLQKRLGDAARHMQHGRDRDAANLLRSLAQEVPEAASVRELYGQVLYSLGRYRQAVVELEAFVELTASTDQHPMLADSYRALGRHKKVAELWAELRESSPAPDIVAEGRIVAAGSLADQNKLHDAIRMLETAPPVRGRVQERHLRTWFALGDLYERAGELAKARAMFQRVRKEDPDFVDVDDRLRALG